MTGWERLAACAGMSLDMFFPSSDNDPCDSAKAVCRRCTVRPACLKFAMDERIDDGVWGGLIPLERRRLRRKRRPGRPRVVA